MRNRLLRQGTLTQLCQQLVNLIRQWFMSSTQHQRPCVRSLAEHVASRKKDYDLLSIRLPLSFAGERASPDLL